MRGEARKKWLQSIMTSAESSGISLDPIYKSVFQALYRVRGNLLLVLVSSLHSPAVCFHLLTPEREKEGVKFTHVLIVVWFRWVRSVNVNMAMIFQTKTAH